jgi:hypothetical protein
MHPLLQKLQGGDRRSIGKSEDVVADVLSNPALFSVVFEAMFGSDSLVSMRAADAVEKITLEHPEYLRPHQAKLIREAARIVQQEVRWHLAQLVSRLTWSKVRLRQWVKILRSYLTDESRIVKTFAMQALADIAQQDGSFRARITRLIEELTRTGSPAMKSRGRKLLAMLKSESI